MKLYPEATTKYLRETGRLKTKSSQTTFKRTMSYLQSTHPSKHVGQFRSGDLIAYCLKDDRAPNTVKRRASCCRQFFGWATWRGLCDKDPSGDIPFVLHPGNHVVRTHRWLSKDEARSIVAACPDDAMGLRDKVIFRLGVSLGLRSEEMTLLRWSMFNVDRSELAFIGKGQKIALMGVPTQLQSLLVCWDSEHPQSSNVVLPQGLNVTQEWNGDRNASFDWRHPLGDAGIRTAVERSGNRVGIRLRPHDLRRSFAGFLEEANMSVQDISRAMRHSNVAVTSRYLERNPGKTAGLTRGFDLDLGI